MLVLLYSIDPESAWFRFSLGFHGRVLCAHTSARRAGYSVFYRDAFLAVDAETESPSCAHQLHRRGYACFQPVIELSFKLSESFALRPLCGVQHRISGCDFRRQTAHSAHPQEVCGSRAGRRRHGRRRTRIRICARRPLSESLRGHMGECGESAWRISIISHHGTPHQPEPSPCTSPAVHPCSSAHCCRCYRIISRARRADVWRLTLEIQYCICTYMMDASCC
ncbi:hypothetical protein OH76DRAFT_44402 [Lentinus brumalis]|uniref:Uncharacterized protein n=1 Tax=Lentinus brumalis TaxID=2498619 RepID=A0A371DY19_9APHY|nr:hypothetical protein OH76DRAFT_44402 [Polyporus brumalis]